MQSTGKVTGRSMRRDVVFIFSFVPCFLPLRCSPLPPPKDILGTPFERMSSIARGYLAAQTLGRGIFPPLFLGDLPSGPSMQLRKAFLLFSRGSRRVFWGGRIRFMGEKEKRKNGTRKEGKPMGPFAFKEFFFLFAPFRWVMEVLLSVP